MEYRKGKSAAMLLPALKRDAVRGNWGKGIVKMESLVVGRLVLECCGIFQLGFHMVGHSPTLLSDED